MSIDKRKKYQCVDCDEKFEYGNFEGCSKNAGGEHVVARKTYYSKFLSYNHEWKMDRTTVDAQNNKKTIPGKRAQFQKGKFYTTDPEAQAFLDEETERGVLITEKRYLELFTPQKVQKERLERKVEESKGQVTELEARVAELEAEKASGGKKGSRRKSA